MSKLARMTVDQLAAERAHYGRVLANGTGSDAKRVAEARLVDIGAEEAGRISHPNGHSPSSGNAWPHVDLPALIRESGCQLHEHGEGKLVGDHGVMHGSKSGECLVVWIAEGRWWCSSCKESGDAAAWIASVQGCDYHTAATDLRLRFGAAPEEPTVDEAATKGQDDDKMRRRPSQATVLVKLAKNRAEFFHDSDFEGFAALYAAGVRQTYSIRSKALRTWLGRLYFEAQRSAASSQAIADAITVLEGEARFAGPSIEVHTRIAGHDGAIFLDLANAGWEAVEVRSDGWRVVTDPPVKFRRTRGLLAIPTPIPEGSLDDLSPFVNVSSDDDWRLLIAWLLAVLRPTGPYPILSLTGEQGSAKSSTARVLRTLVDPSYALLRSEPKDARDLMIAAKNSRVVAFDNLSHLPGWLSDALCRLATGGGFSTRELYTDSEEVIFDAMRPSMFTAIEDVATRGDLIDRVLALNLPSIPEESRRPESEFWMEFEAARPKILGALLDAVSGAMRDLPNVRLSRLPRMADFALWATAAEKSLGWPPGSFLAAYERNRADANTLALDASPVVAPLRTLLAECDGHEFIGEATELLGLLDNLVEERTRKEKGWPKAARWLSGALRRLAPNLRASGIAVDFGRSGDRSNRKVIKLRTLEVSADATDPESAALRVFGPADSDAADAKTGSSSVGISSRARERSTAARNIGTCKDTRYRETASVASATRDSVRNSSASPFAAPTFSLLTSASDVEAELPTILAAPVLGLDTETTGLDPHSDRLRLVQIATPDRVYILDAFATDPSVLRPALESPVPKVLHNGKFDLQFLMAHDLTVRTVFDTLIVDQVVRGSRIPRSLADVAGEYLNVRLDKEEQRSDWSGELSASQLIYAALDASILLPLKNAIDARISADGVARCASLENRAVPAIAWLQFSGAPFNLEAWRALADDALGRKLRLADELNAIAHESAPADLFGQTAVINWESQPQVLKVLRGLGLDVANTTEDALRAVADRHPIVERLLAFREVAKSCGTYGLNVLAEVHPATGRIHADWRQIGADSGRMSCTRPNLQNVPRTPAYRACFEAPTGRVLVKADYSQIELRIAAELTGDRRMLEAYQRGEDLHRLTASLVLRKPLESVSKEDRQTAKALNFGLLYGMGAPSLQAYALNSYGVRLSISEAGQFRERFFAAYPSLRAWHRRQPGKDRAIDTRTMSGRIRRGIDRFTEQLNTPVQGTGADVLKAALALLWETRDRCPSARPVLAVHDEIVIECDEADAWTARKWLTDAMKSAMGSFVHKVAAEVEAAVARDWSLRELVDLLPPGVDESNGEAAADATLF